MSFNQLPDELIAHIGSCLSSEDNCQLAQSQKRIHNILKRDGLTKPEVHQVNVYTEKSNEFHVYKTKSDSDKGIYIERSFDEVDNGFNTFIGKILNEFRSIEAFNIGLRLEDDYDLKELLNTKVEIRCVTFFGNFIFLNNWTTFVNVCKRFKTSINESNQQENFHTDEIFLQLLPNTSFNLRLPEYIIFIHRNLTDKILEALAKYEGYKTFILQSSITSFTTKGIRKLVEALIKNKAYNVTYDLGFLEAEEEIHARRWLREVDESGYEDFNMDMVSEERNHYGILYHSYEIDFVDCEASHSYCIRFSYLKK